MKTISTAVKTPRDAVKSPLLPPELRRLAAVLVHEHLRKQAWVATAAYRRDLRERIEAGEHPDALTAELRAAVEAARRGPGA